MTLLLDRPLVKICGLRDLERAQAVSDAGADLVGLNFSPRSRRQVSVEDARVIVDGLHGEVVTVGLFVEETVAQINATAAAAGVQTLQVYWREDERDLLEFELPYLIVRRTEPGAVYDMVAPDLTRLLESPNPPFAVLIDSYHPGALGGTGVLADWELSAQLARSFPVMLAGGLKPSNVAEAIETVHPAGVDVASGVEVDGIKSPELIRDFVHNARAAFETYSSSAEITSQA